MADLYWGEACYWWFFRFASHVIIPMFFLGKVIPELMLSSQCSTLNCLSEWAQVYLNPGIRLDLCQLFDVPGDV